MPYIDRESVPGPSVPASYTDGVNTACSTVVTSASLLLPGSRTVRQFGSHLDRRFYRGVLRLAIGISDSSWHWRRVWSIRGHRAGLRLCPEDWRNAACGQRLSLRRKIPPRLICIRILPFGYFTRDNPDGHNDTLAPSRSLSPGRFGYSTFAYPVPCSYKLGVHTSLFRSYQPSSPSGITPSSQHIESRLI